MEKTQQTITVLGKTFNSEEERRNYFREELRKKLPELKQMEGFPIGEDEDILKLSDPPYYTACPNPWLNDFIAEWEEEKKQLFEEGRRDSNFNVKSPYVFDVNGVKNDPLYNAHSYHTKVPPNAILKYLMYYTEPGDIVFDGFGGTGMTAVASRMCASPTPEQKHTFNKENLPPKWGERKSIVNDLSPIASNISYNLNNYFSIKDFVTSAEIILTKVKKDFGWLYDYKSDAGVRSELIYCVWSSIYVCPNCQEEMIFWDASMNKEKTKQSENLTCPSCSVVTKKRNCEPSEESYFDDVANESRTRIKEIPVFVSCIENGKRVERKVHNKDLEIIEKIKELKILTYFPKEKILDKGESWGDTYRAGYHKGINRYYDLYTRRNLILISAFYNEITKSSFDERIKKALLFWFTSSQSRLDKTNRYSFNHNRHVGPLANTLYISATPVEISPFYFFTSKLNHFKKVKIPKGNSLVQVGDTTNLKNIKDASVDYMFIDPPYGDNIPYAELNSILESWIKVKTNISREAIMSAKHDKGIYEYQNMLALAFCEYYRILKPGRWMTVIFSNTEASVWNVIQYAISQAGFIVSNVSIMDTSRPGLHGIIGPIAVKQPLVLSCYKPSSEINSLLESSKDTNELGIWSFVEDFLNHVPIHINKGDATNPVIERGPKILFDRLIAFYVLKGLPVPIDAGAFQKGLRERFIERDGMFFTNEQVQEYDKKKAENPEFIQLSILISSEQDGVLWLKNLLSDKSLAYQDIQPLWIQALAGARKGDVIPELAAILEDNFLEDDVGKWFVPNPEKEADLEKLRTKRLLKQFETYKAEAFKPKGKIKEVRVEALRAGFKEAYQEKDFKTIVQIGDRIPNNLLMEDEVLLQFYDIAVSRV
mgnify:CR=1 FL=1